MPKTDEDDRRLNRDAKANGVAEKTLCAAAFCP
jgi:hypothetical protein